MYGITVCCHEKRKFLQSHQWNPCPTFYANTWLACVLSVMSKISNLEQNYKSIFFALVFQIFWFDNLNQSFFLKYSSSKAATSKTKGLRKKISNRWILRYFVSIIMKTFWNNCDVLFVIKAFGYRFSISFYLNILFIY